MDPAGRHSAAAGQLPSLIACALLGALGLLQLPQLPSMYWLLAVLPLAWWRWPGRGRWLAAAFGAVWVGLAVDRQLQQVWPAEQHNQTRSFQAWAEPFPSWRDGTLRMTVRPYRSDAEGLPGRLRLAGYSLPAESLPAAGRCLQISARLRTPSGSLNPGGFDYEAWLFREGIGATGSVQTMQPCTDPAPTRFAARYAQLRQGLRDAVLAGQPDGPGRALAAALLFADRSGLSPAQWRLFRDSGTAHLMAISGLHVGLVAAVAYGLGLCLARLLGGACLLRWPAPYFGWALSLVVATAYAALAGFSVPTARALLMLLVLAGFSLSGWRIAVSRALLTAAGVVFLIWPLSLLSPGFWMSFGAVGLILWTVAGRRWGRWRSWLWLQPVLALGLLPLSLYFFGGSSVLAPLANWIAVPAMAVLLPGLMLAALLEPMISVFGGSILGPAITVLNGALAALTWLVDAFPWPWLSAGFGAPALLAMAAAAALALLPGGLPRWPLAGLLVIAALWPARALPPGQAQLTVLDVGQGSAVVLQTRHHRLLVDAGPAYPGGFDAGEQVVVPYLLRQPSAGLDRILLSHQDLDHRGGVTAVQRYFGAAELLGGADQPCRAGQGWRWDGVQFDILHPADRASWSANNGSCVLHVSGTGWSLLLPGDIEAAAEADLLRRLVPGRMKADVLLVPHHGSRTSSSPGFIRAVDPGLAIVSAGWRHRYGHPHDEILTRFQGQGARVLSTAMTGALEVQLGPHGWSLTAQRTRRRLWTRREEANSLQLTAQTR